MKEIQAKFVCLFFIGIVAIPVLIDQSNPSLEKKNDGKTLGEAKIPLYPGVTFEVEKIEQLGSVVYTNEYYDLLGIPMQPYEKSEWFWRFEYVGTKEQVVEFYEQNFETCFVSFGMHEDEYGVPFSAYSIWVESFLNCREGFKWKIDILVYDDSIVISKWLYPKDYPIVPEAIEPDIMKSRDIK